MLDIGHFYLNTLNLITKFEKKINEVGTCFTQCKKKINSMKFILHMVFKEDGCYCEPPICLRRLSDLFCRSITGRWKGAKLL